MPSNTNATRAATQATVDLYDNGQLVGPATVTGNTWTLLVQGPLALGPHSFTAVSGGKTSTPWTLTVVGAGLNPGLPHVSEAVTLPGDPENIQTLNYFDHGDVQHFHVIVPDYGALAGDRITLQWKGRTGLLLTQVQTVSASPSLQPFLISKYEVIDLLLNQASFSYTVNRPATGETKTSGEMTLKVNGGTWQTYVIPAPTINAGHDNLRVQFQVNFNSSSTAEVRGTAGESDLDTWSSSTQTFGTAPYLNFTVDAAWRARHLGKPVKFNCSIRVHPNDGTQYRYSQLLRLSAL